MTKALRLILMVALAVAVLTGCASRTVSRMDTDEIMDVSGKWNDTDSRLVSEEMIKDVTANPWLVKYKATHNNKTPVVIVGSIRNRSSEHIDVKTFVKDLERALVNSDTVRFVANKEERDDIRDERLDQTVYSTPETAKKIRAETGADFMLIGSLSSINDEADRRKVVYYQVELELIDLESNVKAWIGQKKIKKFVQKKLISF